MRVPTPNVSLVDFKFVAKRATTVEEVNNAIIRRGQVEPPRRHPRRDDRGAAGLHPTSTTTRTPRPSPSTRPRSSTATFVRVVAWYDNEWGFSNRMADTAVAMGKLM